MKKYQRIYLTHANYQKQIPVIADHISFFFYTEKTASTNVFTAGGIFPCLETEQEIEQKLDELAANTKESMNVSRTRTSLPEGDTE